MLTCRGTNYLQHTTGGGERWESAPYGRGHDQICGATCPPATVAPPRPSLKSACQGMNKTRTYALVCSDVKGYSQL